MAWLHVLQFANEQTSKQIKDLYWKNEIKNFRIHNMNPIFVLLTYLLNCLNENDVQNK